MRLVALLLAALVAAPLAGCVVDWTGRSGSYLLREKLDVTRERTRDLQQDLAGERARLDEMDERAADARRRYADSGATVQALMEDLTYVRGQLDSIQHSLGRSGQLTEDMQFQLTSIEVRMGHIEGQLSLHIPDYEPAPLLMPFEDDVPPEGAPPEEAPEGEEHGAVDPLPEAGGEEPVAVVEPEEATPVADPAVSEEEQAFREGLTLIQQGSWKRAGGKLQAFLRDHPDSEWWLESQFLVGRCLYELGRYKAAITEYQKVIVKDDKSPWAPKAMYMQGMSFESLGTPEDLDAAEVFYSELLRLYKRSDEAAKARVRLDALGR